MIDSQWLISKFYEKTYLEKSKKNFNESIQFGQGIRKNGGLSSGN